MTRESYEIQLERLEIEIQNMGQNVENAIMETWRAMEEIDCEIAKKVMNEDRIINDMQRNIEARCLTMITKQQPVAGDLRLISAALKVVTDIERIGDQAADIAELICRFENTSVAECSEHIKPMLFAAKDMVHKSILSLVKRDKKMAQEISKEDDVVDGYFNLIKEEVIEKLKAKKMDADLCVDTLMVAKYLERIGDHAVNIAEWEVFQETGTIQDVRIF
jgi:phosphate transport system protein